ncbi:MAG TPA: SDR family oxidoreductase [Terriglobales bacterium]|nr:SDR family oxidoreductase [Terriglobales bacterium]
MKAMQLFRLDEKVALVTGGTGIYGGHITRALAEAGAQVVVASRRLENCELYARNLAAQGLRVSAEHLDLSVEAEIFALRERMLNRHGRIDVLFNNAVARAGSGFQEMKAEEWSSTMQVNSTGLFLACKVFSEPMQQARSGSIVNIASIYGIVGPDFSIYEGGDMSNPANYAYAKGGMINFTRYLASYLGPFGIRVNCLSPGGCYTPDMPGVFVENYQRRTLLGRMATGEDIQGPAVFLASDASRYITGQNLAVDGGWTAI